MATIKNSLISFMFALLFINATVFAAGNIRGVVTDSLTNEPLFGANVILEGTALGSATDFEGKYFIRGIPEGDYNLIVSYISYKRIIVPVTVKDGRTLELNFAMQLDVVEGEEIVVTGQAKGQAAAINQQLSSNTITNVVSSERIMEMPDANAAESVGRLPGISILREGGEGNKVVIRGLSPTYNAITIGGDRIPATDLNDRSVDLSMISPEILAGIEVTKALTPDKDADALGGTVDFQLATAKRGGFDQNFRVQTGYNNIRNEYGQYKGRLVMSNRFFDDKLGLLVTGNVERAQRGSDEFSAGYGLAREKREDELFAPITTSYAEFEHRIDVRNRYGFSVLVDYEIPGGVIKLNNFVSRLDEDIIRRQKEFAMESNWILYDYRDQQRQIDIISNSLAGEHDITWMKIDWRISRSTSQTRYPQYDRFEFKQTGGFTGSQIPEVAAPDDIITNAQIDLDRSHLYRGQRESELSLEEDWSYQLNFELPYTVTEDIAGNLKFGSKFKTKSRDRDRGLAWHRLDLVSADEFQSIMEVHSRYGDPDFEFFRTESGNAGMVNYLDPSFDFGNFLDGRYDFGFAVDGDELNHLLDNYLLDSLYLFSSSRDLDDYNVEENVFASYVMTELNIGNYLMIMPGVRFERTYGYFTGRVGSVPDPSTELPPESDAIKDTSATNSYNNWFPMVHLRIKPADWFDIRLAYTETLSRPRLDYQLPNVKVSGSGLTVDLGRPDLNPQLSTNYDAYLSIYGNRVGLFTVGAFYKSIDDLIYLRGGHKILNAEEEGYPEQWQGFTLTQPENNPFETEVYGIEVEWQSNLKWLPSPFDGLVINANYSHIWSETTFPRSFVERKVIDEFPYVITNVIDTFRTGKMPDQAADIANLSIGYDYEGFSGRISMLLHGETLTSVGDRPEFDGFSDTYIRWDLSLKYQFTDYIGIFWNFNNLTDEADESYQQRTRYPTNQEFYGWTTDIGLVYKL